METLKAWLLPCNLEQLNDRIDNLSAGLTGMGDKGTIQVSKAFLTEVLNYMEELLGLRREEENRLAELGELRRKMEEIDNLAVSFEEDGPFDDPQTAFDRVHRITKLSMPEEK